MLAGGGWWAVESPREVTHDGVEFHSAILYRYHGGGGGGGAVCVCAVMGEDKDEVSRLWSGGDGGATMGLLLRKLVKLS